MVKFTRLKEKQNCFADTLTQNSNCSSHLRHFDAFNYGSPMHANDVKLVYFYVSCNKDTSWTCRFQNRSGIISEQKAVHFIIINKTKTFCTKEAQVMKCKENTGEKTN